VQHGLTDLSSTMPSPIQLLLLLALLFHNAPTACAESDWDLHMLRLVNRARTDPAGEPARLGSSVKDTAAPMSPLAYHEVVAKAAHAHNQWMLDNLGQLPDAQGSPDTFSHFETRSGQDRGPAAKDTKGFTGSDIGQRMKAAGFQYRVTGENISVAFSTEERDYAIDRKLVEEFHKGWWESDGHRHNMLNPEFRAFGNAADRRIITRETAAAAKLDRPYTVIAFGTQNFATVRTGVSTYVTGLVYEDLDESGSWTPQDAGPGREGKAGIAVTVFNQASDKKVAEGKTSDAGSFNISVPNGTYRVVAKLPAGDRAVDNVKINGTNAVVPDIEVNAAKPR
jgi:hypothetical protein